MVDPDQPNGPFPAIPAEITLAILEALLEIAPQRAVELVTLCHSFRPFIECILYRSITLISDKQMTLFAHCIRSSSRPVSFYQDRIRNVCLLSQSEGSIEDMITILSACRDVHTFASTSFFDSPPRETSAFLSALSILRPIRLHIYLRELNSIGPHWLCKITHLTIWISDQHGLQLNDTVLQHLPQLSHLSHLASCESSVAHALCLSSKMVVCILWIPDLRSISTWLLNVHDPRIVLGIRLKRILVGIPDYVLQQDPFEDSRILNDWGWKTSREPDIWELAEEKVELQRRHQSS
ncbi:hypothetical protein C8J56DRAFT_960014 [Mycena floridula]|nr:hypothetical protein C8J56DRAFT_960014 [Mycena floridula]